MFIFFAFIIPSLAIYCVRDQTFYASTFERKEWDLDTMFYGSDITYSLNGNEEQFQLKQIMEKRDDEQYHIDFTNTTFIDIHTMKYGRFETSIRAFIIKNQSNYQVRYPNIETIYYEATFQISFVRVIRENVLLLVNDTKFWIAKTQNSRNLNSTVIDVQVYDNFIIFITQPEIFFTYYDFFFEDVNITIDQQLLKKFLPSVKDPFEIINVKFAQEDELILLDRKVGIIVLKIIDTKTLDLKFLYDYPSYDKYHSMAILYDDTSYQILVTLSYGQIMMYEGNSTIYMYSISQNITALKLSVIYSSKILKFFTLHNSTHLSIFNINSNFQKIYSKTFTEPMMMTVDYYFSTIYMVTTTSQFKYFISNGLFVMNPIITRDLGLKTVQIIGSEESQCAISINYIIYDYLDNNLYKKVFTDDQIRPFVNYPTYPQISIFKELGVTGSNIKAQIELNDDSIQLNLGYQEEMKISGIIWPQDMVYVNVFHTISQVYYLVQAQSLKATLYLCKIQQFELLCQKIHDFNPSKKLDADSFQWIYNEIVTFGYISKFRHTIELFQLKSSVVNPLFTISTSLKDENSAITSFLLTKKYVFVVMELKQEILIYNLKTKIQVSSINQKDVEPHILKPKSIKLDQEQQLVIIINEESLIIGFVYDRFLLSDYLSFPNCRQITVTMASNTFFVALHYGHLQELLEYSTRLRQINLLKKIPLFHYVLQEPLQMLSKNDLITIRAYTPVLQQTVLLIYQADRALRECLLTHVPLGIYLKDSLNLGITSFTYAGLLIHASSIHGVQNIFIYQNFQAKITSKWNDEYIHKKQLLIKYESIDSPEKIEFVENVTFLNLMTNLVSTTPKKVLQVNERVVKIQNDWFNGFLINYKIECEQCEDQILLNQKIDLISSLDYYQDLLSECQMDDDFFIILTSQSLIFLDNQHLVKYPTFYYQLNYLYPRKVWCKNDTIFITGLTNTTDNFLQMIKFIGKQFRLVGQPYTFRVHNELLQLEILDSGNFLILDGTQYYGGQYYNTARLCPYHYEYTPPSYASYTYTQCVDYRKHTEFYASSFITYKINNKFRVILSDLSEGLFIQDFHYIDNAIKCLAFDDTIIRVSLIQPLRQMIGVNIDDEVRFQKVIKFGEPKNNYQIFKIVVLTSSIAHFSIVLVFDDDIYQSMEIVQKIQRYSTFPISYQASIVENYLALLYQYNTFTIVIYKLDNLDPKGDIILPLGGLEIPYQQPFFFFSLHFDGNHQLLLQLNLNYRKMSLYQVEEYASLTFLDGAIEQPIVLTAQNALTSANMILNVEMNLQTVTHLYWILLSVLLGVVFLLLILALVVYKKYEKKNKMRGGKIKKNEQKLII